MALENKIELTNSADLAREKERISKKKHVHFLKPEGWINWKQESFLP